MGKKGRRWCKQWGEKLGDTWEEDLERADVVGLWSGRNLKSSQIRSLFSLK